MYFKAGKTTTFNCLILQNIKQHNYIFQLFLDQRTCDPCDKDYYKEWNDLTQNKKTSKDKWP